MKYTTIIKKPIITEKSMQLAKSGKYLFEVGLKATKGAVKNAVEDIFGVNVTEVKTLKNSAKQKRSMVNRNYRYRKSAIKKAIVKVKKGQKIDIFDVEKGGKK
ncbi:50S ribosomal protein L23 [candidate division WWE3 bacterium CG09_land_8_20_14_0_10_39_24]|uniref:Large ribosomal subunit protein uL23 n=2 Tax=Katanobacteria TaxID=422282 RepID=A0A2G9XC19_UNCKA|nr:MAG: 50S ribosomal protein L23 [bacterium CG2_30_40_12]OJI08584.1 MAG: 50S ribosomal protein L23 [bacterium CG09_39_24]PIP04506.1 MAG: 50S ribosomal protein L23 [candidate division WWE3 bacterium CG23_combo_of_CG06-09_8_20_14_all_40_14]PIS12752.1 MAG: 50S ribosomal protein L23 [candidate division WWE3 bacterium CG09_land_8_20_14_0_10_39_24]